MSGLSPDTFFAVSIGLLALQVSLLVLTGGIFVTTLCSMNTMLSLIRQVLSDIRSSCVELDAVLDALLVDDDASLDALRAMGRLHANRVAQERTPEADLRGVLGGTYTRTAQ